MRRNAKSFLILIPILAGGSVHAELYDRSTPRCPKVRAIEMVHTNKNLVVVCGGLSVFKIGGRYSVTRSGKVVGHIMIMKDSKNETVGNVIEGTIKRGDLVTEAETSN